MNIDMRCIDFSADEWTLTREIASVLHADSFWKYPDYDARSEIMKPLNFKVVLDPGQNGVRNGGTGTLSLPTSKAAKEFMKWADQGNKIKINNRAIKFFCQNRLSRFATILEKTPYISPDLDEKRQEKLRHLDGSLRIDCVQLGIYYRPKDNPGKRAYSVEWERRYDATVAWLKFEYEHKLLCAELGNRSLDHVGVRIVVTFNSISKIGIGYDFGNPYICFDLFAPPIFQAEDFNRQLTGDQMYDERKFRRRIGSLDAAHARVAPYAYQLRILLYQSEDIDVFERLCFHAGLRRPSRFPVEAEKRNYFSARVLYDIYSWLRTLDWPVAFQIEALIHNGLLNTKDLLDLQRPMMDIYQRVRERASVIFKYFSEALQTRPPQESPRSCLERVQSQNRAAFSTRVSQGMFMCHHVTFTPTRMLLDGPIPSQSNRVIRSYHGYEDNFIRVDFRDENRLQYRWDRDVDGTSFLQERVGGILKGGFELAGRKFEYLAYSSSALHSHAVWFIHPFVDANGRHVNAESIIASLGDFSGVIRYPSKYAARISQAFSGTDPSVRIVKGQWEEMPDMGKKPYIFTDGVGTVSLQLADMIWDALRTTRRDYDANVVKPSAYQIRFLGYKGVVSVDLQLEGIKLRLRESMDKFQVPGAQEADIEIAESFTHPLSNNLNRALIMVLEDQGVDKEAFLNLQHNAVAEARTIDDSLENFRKILYGHKLATGYRLSYTVEKLNNIGLDLGAQNLSKLISNPFLDRVRKVAMNHVLRSIKHKARIPVPDSYLLVGVTDEGPAYAGEPGYENVYTLDDGKIYACIQKPGDPEPTFLKGSCTISRSPVVHPGDVQRVYAIGEPPKGQLCLFRHLKNVVVFPSKGKRSLPSHLAGGDLDGDLYAVIFNTDLLTTEWEAPADYTPSEPRKIERDSTTEDICDFIVEYINSDVVGLLSDRHLVIADQARDGTRNDRCLKLAELCSQAVDYPKNGIAVDIDQLPRFLIPYKPDWHAAEVEGPHQTDYYESSRALGHLYRSVVLDDSLGSPVQPLDTKMTGTDTITLALAPLVKVHLQGYDMSPATLQRIEPLFLQYKDELQFISATYTISSTLGQRISEAEIVVGTILAKCSQTRWRSDRIQDMKLHTQVLLDNTLSELFGNPNTTSVDEIRDGLKQAWCAWNYSLQQNKDEKLNFGMNSFGLIALSLIFDCLEKLEQYH